MRFTFIIARHWSVRYESIGRVSFAYFRENFSFVSFSIAVDTIGRVANALDRWRMYAGISQENNSLSLLSDEKEITN